MKNKLIVGCVALAMIGFQSCQKSNTGTGSSSLTTNLAAAVGEVVTTKATQASSIDVQSVSVEKFDGNTAAIPYGGIKAGPGGLFGMGPVRFGIPHIDSCAVVTVSSSTYPKEITIDYGTGCTDRMGHTKKGKIIIDLSDTITNAGAVQTITYQNFWIDSIQIEFTASLKNLGQNSSGHWVIEKKSDQTITKNGDKVVESNDESDEWVSGFTTTDRSDDIFYESGSGSVTVNDTATFTRTITKPLTIDRSCEFITSGTVVLTRNGSTITIDYGDGTCDNKATVTTNGTTETIELHGGMFQDGGEFGKHCGGFGSSHGEGGNMGKENGHG